MHNITSNITWFCMKQLPLRPGGKSFQSQRAHSASVSYNKKSSGYDNPPGSYPRIRTPQGVASAQLVSTSRLINLC